MRSTQLLAAVFASVVSAATPPGFQPSSDQELTIAFGNTLATAGTNLPKITVQNAPTVGTAMQLSGTFSIVMVDPDLPPNADGTSRGTFLHWMQTDLVSSSKVTVTGGRSIFPMVAGSANTAAIAPYTPPSPPNMAPNTHRYILMVVNTTNNQAALTALATVGQTRIPFDTVANMRAAGLQVLAANWFTVTNGTGGSAATPASGSVANPGSVNLVSTSVGGVASPTGSGLSFHSVGDVLKTPGAIVTGLGLLIGFFL